MQKDIKVGLIVVIVVFIILILAYWFGSISGATFWIILLAVIALLEAFYIFRYHKSNTKDLQTIVNSICTNKECDSIKLPFNLDKVGADGNQFVYRVSS